MKILMNFYISNAITSIKFNYLVIAFLLIALLILYAISQHVVINIKLRKPNIRYISKIKLVKASFALTILLFFILAGTFSIFFPGSRNSKEYSINMQSSLNEVDMHNLIVQIKESVKPDDNILYVNYPPEIKINKELTIENFKLSFLIYKNTNIVHYTTDYINGVLVLKESWYKNSGINIMNREILDEWLIALDEINLIELSQNFNIKEENDYIFITQTFTSNSSGEINVNFSGNRTLIEIKKDGSVNNIFESTKLAQSDFIILSFIEMSQENDVKWSGKSSVHYLIER